ncbi:hypothetical protein F4778DRAFT_744458 [Xylariomycetidae sp. FL2044]|nr:hypothetical protein F4778DRAFT_744458 [Xylariomycetidae sp. FL2044]
MDRRTYESPMDWEYQDHGPMDPSSPFVQTTKFAQNKNTFGSSNPAAFGQNSFNRAHSTPSKPLPPTPSQPGSIFSSSHLQRTTTAPPFRNPAFTTPRKPFDVDAMSEFSAAESSPAATDASDLLETPETDRMHDLAQMTITPASMSRTKSFTNKKASGKGEIAKTMFATRDKVRKRKRYNEDKDISGYRLPYIQQSECEDSDYESDESTFEPGKAHKQENRRNSQQEGWVGSFFALLQRHPFAPEILRYWLELTFSIAFVTIILWVAWSIVSGLRQDFATARNAVRQEILDSISKCTSDYRENKCSPIEQRLPAMYELCDTWYDCMNQNPDHVKNIQLGAKNIIEIVNEIVDTMSYKTMILVVLFFALFLFSGRSIYKTSHGLPDFPRHPHAYNPVPSEQAYVQPAPQQVYWQAIPQTPRHFKGRHLLNNEETPDTDGSPPRSQAIMGPRTPASRMSPSKGERGRSPTKSRSPTKRY